MIKKRVTRIFLGLMAIAFCKVAIEALVAPQLVLANVGITLENASAFSSMRAVYGGMHLTFGIACLIGVFRNAKFPLQLLILYTSGFIIGRLISILTDGTPNEFVMMWLITETFCLIISVSLLMITDRKIEAENAIAL